MNGHLRLNEYRASIDELSWKKDIFSGRGKKHCSFGNVWLEDSRERTRLPIDTTGEHIQLTLN